MAKVYPVDEALIERTAQWLLAQQQPDGTWADSGYSGLAGRCWAATAYITWALIEAGYEDTPEVAQAIDLHPRVRAAGRGRLQPGAGRQRPGRLRSRRLDDAGRARHAVRDARQDGDTVYWQMGDASFMGATGESGSLETTALAAYALMRAGAYPDAVSGALAYLIQGKDSWGTWSTTQATILSLKALLLASEQAGRPRARPRSGSA